MAGMHNVRDGVPGTRVEINPGRRRHDDHSLWWLRENAMQQSELMKQAKLRFSWRDLHPVCTRWWPFRVGSRKTACRGLQWIGAWRPELQKALAHIVLLT